MQLQCGRTNFDAARLARPRIHMIWLDQLLHVPSDLARPRRGWAGLPDFAAVGFVLTEAQPQRGQAGFLTPLGLVHINQQCSQQPLMHTQHTVIIQFFNMLVFFKPKCIKYQQEHPGTSLAKCYLLIVFKFEIRLASILKQKFKQKFKRNNDVEEQNDAVDVNNVINVNDGIRMRSYEDDRRPEIAAEVELPRDIEMISIGRDAAAAPVDEPTGDSRRRGSFVARVRRTSITGLLEFDPIDIDDGIGFQRYNEHRSLFQDRDAISLDGMNHEARD